MKITKKMGFTLIELLAAMVILGIVLVIAVPSVMNAITTSYQKTYEYNLKALQSAAKDYVISNGIRVENTKQKIINISQMIEDNYIKEVVDPETKGVCEGFITVTRKNSQYIYKPFLKCENYVSENYDDISKFLPTISITGSNPTSTYIDQSYADEGATAKDYYNKDITSEIVVTSNVDISIPGSYTIIYTVIDDDGNTGSATRIVNVIDNIGPTIAFEPNTNPTYAKSREVGIKVSDVGGVDESSLKYVWSTSSTQPGIALFTAAYINNQVVSSPSNVGGIYYLWAVATDDANNQTVKSSGVFYLDNIAPIVTVTGSNPITISKGSTYTDAGATATDNRDGSVSVSNSSDLDINRIGTYTVTYTATDSCGNTGMTTRTVNVIDTQAPVITLNGSNPTNINVNGTYADAGAIAIDDVDGDVTSEMTTTGTVNPSVVGSYTITYTVKDSSNNTATKTRTVNVIDTVLPTVAFGTNGNSTYAKTRSTTVTASDNYSLNTSSLEYQWTTSTTTPTEASFTTTFTNGATISSPGGVTGSYYLWILAKDTSSNTLIARTNVFNLDNTKPIITINGSSSVTVNKGSTYTDAGATATDAHSGLNGSVASTGSVNPSVIGTYTITYNVSDNAGNAATSVTRTINVVDVLSPVITILGSNPVNINVNGTYSDAGATALDDVDGNVTSRITTTGTVNPSVVGAYTITYTVKDNANNTANATRTVNVIDNVLPTVAFGTNGNGTYAKTGSTTVTASDNYSVNTSSLKYQWTTSTTAPTEASFSTAFTNGGTVSSPAGVTGGYYLWILAKDTSGNTTIVRTNVFNMDNTAPTISTAIAGTMMFTDPTFASGTNGTNVYNNAGDGTVTVTRTTISGAPLGSGYGLEIKNVAGTSTPGFGGFRFAHATAASKVYVTRIVAKIPVGYSINWASNAIGGGTSNWLTSNAGTGDWEEYIYQVNVGTNGTYSTTDYFYISGSPTPTAGSPLIWYVAYATVFDTTKFGTSNSMAFTSSDSNSGIVGYGINQSSSTQPTYTSVTNTSTLNTGVNTIATNGTYYVWTKDAAGNTSNKSFVVNYVDTTAPTIATTLKSSQLATFSNWTLLGGAYIDGNGKLVLPTTGSSYAASPYIPASGTVWNFEMDGLVINPSPNCTPNGGARYSVAYFDINYVSSMANNGYAGNGYAPSLPLNVTTPISWDGWAGNGPNVYYVTISVQADGSYSVAPLTLSNFKFITGGMSNYAKIINVTASDTNGIVTTKWLAGAKVVADFSGAGTVFTGFFEVTSNGTYTIYTEDPAGNKTVYQQVVNDIDTTSPTVAFGTNGNSTWAKTRSTTVTVTDSSSGVNTNNSKYQWTTSTTTPSEASFSTTFTSGATLTSPAGVTGGYYLWVLAKDKLQNTTITRSNVFNLDNTKPVITMNGSASVTINTGSTYTDAGATATDVNSGLNGSVTSTGTVNTSVPGTYTITYNVSDNAGNAATAVTRTITVNSPLVTCNSSNSLAWDGSIPQSGTCKQMNYYASCKPNFDVAGGETCSGYCYDEYNPTSSYGSFADGSGYPTSSTTNRAYCDSHCSTTCVYYQYASGGSSCSYYYRWYCPIGLSK